MKLPRLIIGCAVSLSVGLASEQLAAQQRCSAFAFPKQDNVADWVSTSLAKVYDAEKGGRYLGTATVIDTGKGLLLTATHVARSGEVYVLFPRLQDGRRYRAKTWAHLEQADGEDEDAGRSWNEARDIAVIKLEQPERNVTATEIWMENLVLRKVNFFSFADDAATIVHGAATPSVPSRPTTGDAADCTYDLREATEDGDSGSPVVDETGLLLGVMIQARNNHRAGRFVPAYCFVGWLLKKLHTIDPDVGQTALKTITEESLGRVSNMLKPPQRNEWITNFRFASAIDLAGDDRTKAARLQNRHPCPLRPAILDRGLGGDLYDKYRLSLPARQDSKEQAEELQRHGQALLKAGYTNSAAASYAAASKSYLDAINNPGPPTLWYDKHNQTNVAQSFKGLADVQTRLAELTQNKQLLTEAKSNAATAALLAPYQNTFKGSAIAAFAYASQKLGDPETAIMGYTAATKLGYKKPWILENYNAAFQSKESMMAVSQPPDYVPMGEYESLSEGRLKESVTKPDYLKSIQGQLQPRT